MPRVVWAPEARKPQDAEALEGEIHRVAPGAEVTLTLADDGAWMVRALRPAALCARGADVMARDASDVVAQVLNDHDVAARIFRRRPRLSS